MINLKVGTQIIAEEIEVKIENILLTFHNSTSFVISTCNATPSSNIFLYQPKKSTSQNLITLNPSFRIQFD